MSHCNPKNQYREESDTGAADDDNGLTNAGDDEDEGSSENSDADSATGAEGLEDPNADNEPVRAASAGKRRENSNSD